MTARQVNFTVHPGGPLRGTFTVPGDKSVSHRAVMFSALAEGESRISGFLDGEDTIATIEAFRAMGVLIERPSSTEVVVHGVGLRGLSAPPGPLDLGNSGTSTRLLAGILSGQSFDSELVGDASLMKRPMRRVAEPLSNMGARIECAPGGTLPMRIRGGATLRGMDYVLPVASAQVKSAVLLAGLYAEGTTCVTEPAVTRDHTERMLAWFGCPVNRQGGRVCVQGGAVLRGREVRVPGDISSAAFFLVGASIVPGSDLTLLNVGMNPTRSAVIDILRAMGADIEVNNEREESGEPVADLRVRHRPLSGIPIPPHTVSIAIDEFPAVLVAAAAASGETVLTGAAELRVKESDRIQAMADGLTALGIEAEALPDGIVVRGGRFRGGTVDSLTDHRIAMSFSIAALVADGPVRILDCANVKTSFPGFPEMLRAAGGTIETETA